MEKTGYIIGYDLNERGCQISYYDEDKHELKTLEVAADNYQIPLMVGHYKEAWMFGREAQRAEAMEKGWVVSDLYRKALRNEEIEKDGIVFEARWLLYKFIELTLQTFRKKKIIYLTFTVPHIDKEIRMLLKNAGKQAGVEEERIYAADYKESFCYYMLYQPKELWQDESALFYCDREKIQAYMLKKINTDYRKEKESFISVEEVAEAEMEELKAVYPVLNVDKARNADERFKHFITGVFNKKHVSSVYLTGEGFENNWYPNSQKVLCNGRRAFIGNNLYSKGACFCGLKKLSGDQDIPTYLDETKMIEQICLKMRIDGEDVWYPIVAFGTHWYENNRQWEVLLEDTDDIEIHIESLVTGEWRVEMVSFAGMPKRKEYSMKINIRTEFQDEHTCRLIFTDAGFGEFFPATGFRVEKTIYLGGTNGQFNSLS